MAFNKNKVMDSARKYVEKGQVDRAIKEYLRVVREDPKDVRVWLKIGDLYAKKGAKQDATETYLKVAKFYSEQGFYLKAVAVYKQILKLDSRLVEVNLKLAELYRQLGLLSDAMQHFEMVAAHFHREGKTTEALATVRQLVDLDPENVATRIKLAELYSKGDMVEEAVKEFAQACDYLRSHGRQDDFIKVAERLLWHKPDNQDLNRELATLYLRRNDARRALQKLQVCFKANSRDVETLALLAQAFQALDQKAKTVSVLKELARVLIENGQKDQASEVHRKILAFVPDDPDSRAFLGEPSKVATPPPPEPVQAVGSNSSANPRNKRFDLTQGDLPPPRAPNRTGSMPLIREEQPFSDPELVIDEEESDEDFVAELSMDDDVNFNTGSVAGEMHSEEIVKILTETDVYVKYGLHQKAIDHLRRVFELDAQNAEARERLKEIYITQGREDDAITELMTLAEQAANSDPDRAEMYIAEILGIDGTHQPAFDLARRYRLEIHAGPQVEIVDESDAIEISAEELHTGGVTPIEDEEIDFGDIDFDSASSPDAPLTLDPADNYDQVSANPSASYATADGGSDGFEFDLDDIASDDGMAMDGLSMDFNESTDDDGGGTMEVSLDQVEDMVPLLDEDVGEELDFDSAVGQDYAQPSYEQPNYPPNDYAPVTVDQPPPLADPVAFDAQPIDDLAGFENDFSQGGAPTANSGSFGDPAYGVADDGGFVQNQEFELGADDFEEVVETDLVPPALLDQVAPPTVDQTVDSDFSAVEDSVSTADSSATSLEDDLDEADFFVTQSLFGEARDILHGLLGRYPNHPLVMAKLQDMDAMEMQQTGRAPSEAPQFDLSNDTQEANKPAVLLEKPVDDEDADTHYDLGLAYKEMGLNDEAIKAFEKIIHVSGREVQCHQMIGLCYREKGAFSEAVQKFKSGLHIASISDAEKLSLYYEIGLTYEALNDVSEALYYFEMVVKKDPGYRDVRSRVEALRRNNGASGGHQSFRAPPEDTDSAIDSLLAESDDDLLRG